jgi:hypothetical protein
VDDLVVFESPNLFDADAAAVALEDSAIPVRRAVFVGGIECAMPLAPSQVIGGQIWLIRVPRACEEHARRVLSGVHPLVAEVSGDARPFPQHTRLVVGAWLAALAALGLVRYCG